MILWLKDLLDVLVPTEMSKQTYELNDRKMKDLELQVHSYCLIEKKKTPIIRKRKRSYSFDFGYVQSNHNHKQTGFENPLHILYIYHIYIYIYRERERERERFLLTSELMGRGNRDKCLPRRKYKRTFNCKTWTMNCSFLLPLGQPQWPTSFGSCKGESPRETDTNFYTNQLPEILKISLDI